MTSGSNSSALTRHALLGTWKMKSWTRKLVGSDAESDAFGPNPIGFINYAADGRMMVLVVRSDRQVPASPQLTPLEKIALFDSMFAYCGTFTMDAGKVVQSLDASWNHLWTGTKQTRLLDLDKESLKYTTSETVDPMDGKRCTYAVTFERVKPYTTSD